MKDYYQILGVTVDSAEDEIRRRYRKLAMEFHPDRNPDDPQAEEKFKEVAEAYGVLTDPVKRREYDACRSSGRAYGAGGGAGGFNYSQDEILKDLFKDPRFQVLFQNLLREFQRSGFRANQHFIRKSFFGGRGGLFIGGLFLFGSIAGPALARTAKEKLSGRKSVLREIGSSLSALLGRNTVEADVPETAEEPPKDTTYVTPLSSDELKSGKVIQVVSHGETGQEMYKVKIPPGSRHGQRLRLRGKGIRGPQGRGDLYLQLEER